MGVKILYEDKNITVAVKPPGIPSQPDKTGDADMLSLLSESQSLPFPGIVHRLDRGVAGVMVFAKDKQSLSKLSAGFSERSVEKRYMAVLMGRLPHEEGTLRDYIVKRGNINKCLISGASAKDAKEAVLNYKVRGRAEDKDYGALTLVEIWLETGRHHQIRLQFSNLGYPVWGDIKYGKNFKRPEDGFNIALFSYFLKFRHPVSGRELLFTEKPEGFPFDKFKEAGL